MFNEFILAVIRDIHLFLVKEESFFTLPEKKRVECLEASPVSMAPAFKLYLTQASEESFLSDLKLVTRFLKNDKGANIKGNAFMKALLTFLVGPFSKKADTLGSDFVFFSDEDKKKVLEALIAGQSAPAGALKKILATYLYPQYSKAIQTLSVQVGGAPYLSVQGPREMDAEFKALVREHLLKEHEFAYPVFQVQRSLIGGFRVFNNGESIDYSWLNRVLSIRSLTL